jgi:hypothetical protein
VFLMLVTTMFQSFMGLTRHPTPRELASGQVVPKVTQKRVLIKRSWSDVSRVGKETPLFQSVIR